MIIPDGYAQVTHFFGGAGLPEGAAVVHGVDLGAVLSPAVAAEAAWNAWNDSMQFLYTIDMRIESTLCKFGPNDTGNFGTFEGLSSGGAAGSMAPPNVAVLIEKRTDAGGRSGRGRLYMPGAPEGEIQINGDLTPSYLANVTTGAGDYLTALAAAEIPMTLLHNSVLAPNIVTELSVDPRVATQRRRLR